jgi:aminoglycoside phosphotransferase (APT) family kinase protein
LPEWHQALDIFIVRQEYIAAYCGAANVAPPSAADWAFYLALSLFRLLAILAGVAARAKQVLCLPPQ